MKNSNFFGRFAVLFLLGIFILSLPIWGIFSFVATAAVGYTDVTSDIPEGVPIIATLKQEKFIQMWRYSGGFWRATVDNSTVQFSAAQVQSNYDNLSALVGKGVEMEFNIPNEVQTAMSSGKNIGITVFSEKGDMFEGTPQFRIEGGKLFFRADPKFHFTFDFDYTNFVPNLQTFIPFVDPDYGNNVYSVFRGSTNIGAVRGYFNPNNPTEIGPPGTIHPTQIIGVSGKLKPGFIVRETFGSEYRSEDVTIGLNTFSSGGAVGLHFIYPINISFFEADGVPATPDSIPAPDLPSITPIGDDDVDLASNIIGPLIADPGQTVNIRVQAINLGKAPQTSTVAFTVQGRTQTQNVSLNGGEVKELIFPVTAPPSGSLGLTSNIDPQNRLPDVNRANNRSTATLRVQFAAPVPTNNCELATINWSEIEGHTFTYTELVFTWSGWGFVTRTGICNHVYDYQAKLEVDPITFLYQDKPEHQMKSGYGFYIEATTRIVVNQVGNNGICGTHRTRAHSETVQAPTVARYYAPSTARPQTVTNRLGTQRATIDLSSDRRSPVTKFTTPANSISERRNRLIYTDPNWADGRHFFDMRFQGGGVAGRVWCLLRRGSVANRQYVDIIGSMYEDDYTG
jgi:hypothetical protein